MGLDKILPPLHHKREYDLKTKRLVIGKELDEGINQFRQELDFSQEGTVARQSRNLKLQFSLNRLIKLEPLAQGDLSCFQ